MKNFLTILLGFACVAVLFFGHSFWNQRIQASPQKTSNQTENKDTAATLTVKSNGLEKDLTPFTGNWPASAVDRFKQLQDENIPFKILFVGSPAIGTDTTGMFPIVKEKLNETFGKDIQVGIKTYNSTSTQVINNQKQDEIAAEKADLVVLEPFILLNNGNVLTKDTLNDITKIIDVVKAANPDVTFILQPSYPLYNAKIYPKQVEELKVFAKNNQITYLDHWAAWPDPTTNQIKEYLSPDQSAPNEKGNQVWSDYLIQFLISKSES